MFIWHREGEIWITFQTDHMAQVGDFAARWGGKGFSPVGDPASAVVAARNHDEGWRSWEMDPDMDPSTGLPFDFFKVPREKHTVFYGTGVEFLNKAATMRAALLVSLHATGLYLGRYGVDGERIPALDELEPYKREFVERQEDFQGSTMERLGIVKDDLWHDYKLLQAWDRLGICFCHGRDEAVLGPVPLGNSEEGVRIQVRRLDPLTVEMDPFPFVGDEQEFPVRSFKIAKKQFDSPEEWRREISITPASIIGFRAVAAAG